MDSWRVAVVDPIGRAGDSGELLLGEPKLRRYMEFVAAHRGDSVPVVTSCSHYYGRYEDTLRGRPFECLCRLLGFLHSHPGALTVSLSEGDLSLHRGLAGRGLCDLSLLLNPHRPDLIAYAGEDCRPADTVILTDRAALDVWKAE